MSWLNQSLLATALLIPVWLAIGFFDKNYNVKSYVFIVWYFVGVIAGTIFYSLWNEQSLSKFLPYSEAMVMIFVIGITIGCAANILLFNAIQTAPNPGIPLAISSWSNVGVFLAAVWLGNILPKYFAPAKIDMWSFVGVILAVIGVSIIAIRR